MKNAPGDAESDQAYWDCVGLQTLIYQCEIHTAAGIQCFIRTILKPDTPLTALPYSPSLDTTSMDRTVDPCTDFYRYSCGAWIKKNPIPPDQSSWDVYGKLAEDNRRFLWGILEGASQPSPNRSQVETEIGDYFYACMDEAAVEKAGLAPLQAALDEIAALNRWRPSRVVGSPHLSGENALFRLRLRSGFRGFHPCHRLRLRRRTGLARPRLLRQDRREIGRNAREYLEHVGKLELGGEAPQKAKAGDAQS